MAPTLSMKTLGRVAAALLLAQGADAARNRDQKLLEADLDPPVTKVFAEREGPVCGGRAIRDFLTAPKTVTEVRNIPWVQVFAVADEFLRTQATEVDRLKAEVDRLQAEVALKDQQEAPQPLPSEQVVAGITAALAAAGSYGSVDAAKASQCGARLVKPRATRAMYQAAAAAFQAGAKALLQDGHFSARSQAVADRCAALLAASTDGASNCGELCQAFADAAQAASDELVGAQAITGKSADQVRRELEAARAALLSATSQLNACQDVRGDVSVFRSQLEGLKQTVAATNDQVMDARDALLDAQDVLASAEADVSAKATAAEAAVQLLQGSSQKAAAAQAELQKVATAAGSVRAAAAQAATEMTSAQVTLQGAQAAANTLKLLKEAVSVSMMNMQLYFEEAVRAPVRKLGLGEDVNVDGFFPKSLTALPSAGAMRAGIESLSTFCNLPETRRALASAKAKPEQVQALCDIGNVPEVEGNIDAAVQDRVDKLKESLRSVQSWVVDTYKGQKGFDKTKVDEGVAKGEPVGLREVIAVFSQTTYYRNYLQEWKLKGKFLRLYNTLFAALAQAQAAQEQAATKLAAVKTQLQAAEQAQATAQTAVAQAIEAKQVAAGKEAEAQAALQTLSSGTQQLRVNLQALEAAFAEATRRYNAALAALSDTHREGVSLLQALEELESLA